MQLQPAIYWSLVWDSLHNVILPDAARSACYVVIHDIIPTNSTEGHGKLYTVREEGHHTTSTHRMWGETGDLGMDSHKVTLDTQHGPETHTEGMAPSSLFQTTTPTNMSGELLVFGECDFYVVNQRKPFSALDYFH